MSPVLQASDLRLPGINACFVPYAKQDTSRLIVHLGYLDNGKPFYMDIQDKSHLFITGDKGTGKTTLLHNIICSLISTYSEQNLQIVLISNGKSGFSNYNHVPHLYSKVAMKEKTILSTLDNILLEIRNRKMFAKKGNNYNRVVIIADELSSLSMMGNIKALQKLSEIVRDGAAVGFYLIIATKMAGYDLAWNYLLNQITTRIALHISSTKSIRIIKSDLAGKIQMIGEGYAVAKGKTPLHFQSYKVHVQDVVARYEELEQKKRESLAQSYIQAQKARKDFYSLDPYQFEEYVAQRMRENGYTQVTVTAKSGDYGADVLGVDTNGNKVCVQCKQYTTKVGFDAVQQINTARTLFNCKRAMLVTTNTVTNQARNAANQLQVELIENFNPSTKIS